MKHKLYKKQISILLSIVFGVLFLIGIFNYLVDPYAIYFSYDNPTYSVRPYASNNSRLEKLIGVIRKKPEIIFLGSSIVNHGYDTKERVIKEILEKHKLKKVYNAALSDGRISESRLMLEHAVVNNPNLKEVIVGLDVMGMTNGYHDENSKKVFDEIAGKTIVPLGVILRTTLTVDALWSSIQTLAPSSINRFSQLMQNPFALHANSTKPLDSKYIVTSVGGRDLTIMLTYCDFILYQLRKTITKSGISAQEFIPEETINEIGRMVQIAKDHNIKLHLVINPSTPAYILSIKYAGIGEVHKEIVKKVTQLHPVLDFINDDKIWDPDVKVGQGYFLGDPLHFPAITGSVVLDKIFSNNVNDLLVTKTSINNHLQNTERKLKFWLNKNTYTRDYMRHAKEVDYHKQNPALFSSNIGDMPPIYNETYNGYAIFTFMGNVFAIPDEHSSYDLLKIKAMQYKNIKKFDSFESAKKQIK